MAYQINLTFHQTLLLPSNYPKERTKQDGDGVEYGVAGTVEQIQNVILGTQPLSGFDWSPDKVISV